MVYQIPPNGIRNPVGPRFRGEWNQWGEIIRYKDFSQEASINPAIIEVESNVNAPGPNVAVVTGPELRGMENTPSDGRPELEGAQAVHTYIAPTVTNTGKHYINILLSGLQLPVDYSVTKVSFSFYRANTYSGVLYSAHVNHVDYGPQYTENSYGTWNQAVLTPPNMSSSSKVGVRIYGDHGSTNRNATVGITNITVWGVPTDSRYILGDTVSYDGELWRNLVDGNNDEPGTTPRWAKVSHTILPPNLRSLNDVDLVGLYDRANLTYWAEDKKWHPGDKTEDQRNFRGDWQDPANTLLWSSNFNNPADVNFFEKHPSDTTISTATLSSRTTLLDVTGKNDVGINTSLRIHSPASNERGGTLPLTNIGLGGNYISRIEYWKGASFGNSTGGKEVRTVVDGTTVRTRSQGGATSFGWSEVELPIFSVMNYLRFAIYSQSGTPNILEITGLKIYGAVDNEDLYRINDIVSHNGFFWRSLFNLNAVEPSEEAEEWEKIGDIFAQKTYALSSLTDVDLSSKYEGAILKYDEEYQVWRAGPYAPDYRNFRGDWQDPSDTLLWSTNFVDVGDISLFEEVYDGSISPTISARTGLLAVERAEDVVHTTSLRVDAPDSTPTGVRLPLENIGLNGRYISRVEAWVGGSYSNDFANKLIQIFANGTVVEEYAAMNTTYLPWFERVAPVETLTEDLSFKISSVSGSPNILEITGIRIYGAVDLVDLYRINDVVSHSGYFWRSLFDYNSEEPSDEAEQWEKISEFVVDGHVYPQGIGRVEDLPLSTSRSGGTFSQIYQEVTPKEDFWLDKVRFYTGGGGDCAVYVRDLQGTVLRTGTFNTEETTTTTPEWFEATLDFPLHLTAESSYLVGFVPTTSVNTHRDGGLYDGTMWRTRRAVLNGFDWLGGASTYSETHGMGLVEFDSTI